MTDADKACVMELADCSVTISKTAYTYTGKTIRPAVTVTCKKLDGTTITLKKTQIIQSHIRIIKCQARQRS